MKSIELVNEINLYLRQLHKVESMQRNGQVIDANRVVKSVISKMNNLKEVIIKEEE